MLITDLVSGAFTFSGLCGALALARWLFTLVF